MNKVMLIGHLGADPKMKERAKTKVCTFSLATNERGKEGERTSWHQITAFGALAETCALHLAKGRHVAIEGSLRPTTFKGKDGKEKYSVDIIAREVEFLGKKNLKSSN